MPNRPNVLLMGQTPPPWHGQAVATQILFNHDWSEFEVHRLRMEFSEEMEEVGRFQWRKIGHLFHLIRKARAILKAHPGCILFYPPASAKWIPFLRDVAFLCCVRRRAAATVFIYHASGLPVFVQRGKVRYALAQMAYGRAEVALEVAQEVVAPHEIFAAKSWQWCPCAIEVPDLAAPKRSKDSVIRVLFVGSLQEGKGVLEILKTAALLKAEGRGDDFRFRIVGKWFSLEFESEVVKMRTELALETMVELVGELTGTAKWEAYATAELFFFPTHYASEATPIVLMEALGMGLPILATEWAGIPAMLEGCTAAELLPIRAPERYVAALIAFADRSEEVGKTARVARQFYQDHFLPERFVERVGANWRSVTSGIAPIAQEQLRLTAYLADQNPGHDRSFGISRMSQIVLEALAGLGGLEVEAVTSKTSQQPSDCIDTTRVLPWGTRNKFVRLLTDHIHPLFNLLRAAPDLYYFPKGYLPILSHWSRPSVVTIHDTIIQYDDDNYPKWRNRWEYSYWAMILKHSLRHADRILTVSEFSKGQIQNFMKRHGIASKEITVTYEPCLYEKIVQPLDVTKGDYVIHLASCEPHKRTAHLIRWWCAAESSGLSLPLLHLIGTVPPEVVSLLASSRMIVKRPFLEDSALQVAYLRAKALILPSEIEGFGLPAVEAYYLGTPVCYVKGTSVEEVLGVATVKGGFSLDDAESLFEALDEVLAMTAEEVWECGMKLREMYAAAKVAERMMQVFQDVGRE